jgi:transposase
VNSIHSHLAWLRQCIKELEGQIDDHIDGHPQLKQDADLIKSIPGLGETTAAKVLAFVGDVRRFSTAKALAAYVGVTPRLRQSGSALRGHTIISRSGHTAMRAALYMPAMVALKHNQVIKAFGQRLATKGLTPKAVIAASMHKLVHIIYGVVRSGLPFNPLIAMPPLDFQDGI